MDQERPSPSASEVATVVPRWRSGSDIHQSTRDGALDAYAMRGINFLAWLVVFWRLLFFDTKEKSMLEKMWTWKCQSWCRVKTNRASWICATAKAASHPRSNLPPNEECGHRENDAQGQEPQGMDGRARLRELLLGLSFVGLLFLPLLLVLFVMLLLVVHDSSRFDEQ
jgi:hypothetical protein